MFANSKLRTLIVCALLAVTTLAIYWPLLKADFITLDDDVYVASNTHVEKGLVWENVGWAFRTTEESNWHPLTWLSHCLDYQLFNRNPGGHHLTNIIFHIANTLLLFLWLRQLTGAFWRSFLVAGLFAWHPMHVESVAWVAERKDVLSTFFWMLALITFHKYQMQRAKNRNFFFSSLFCFALGLLSKPMVVTLPFALLLIDLWEEKLKTNLPREFQWNKMPWGKLIVEKIPFFALSIASCIVTYVVQKKGGAMNAAVRLSTDLRISNTLVSYVRYLDKTFWPHDFAILYPYPNTWPLWQVMGSVIMLSLISIWSIRLLSRQTYIAVGWFWFLGTLVPAIGLVQVGLQAMADRYGYIPLIGLFVITAWGLKDLAVRWPSFKLAFVSIAIVMLGVCASATSTQIRYWKNSEPLFKHSLEVTKNNYTVCADLGAFYMLQNRPAEALPYFEAALRINPVPDAGVNLGYSLEELNRMDEATTQFNRVIATDPNHRKAHFHLGIIALKQGRTNDAIQEFRRELELSPDGFIVRKMLAEQLDKQGNLTEAIDLLLFVSQAKLDDVDTENELATLLAKQKRNPEAIAHYKETVRLYHKHLKFAPDSPALLNNLAWILAANPNAEIRNGAEAVKLALQASNLTEWKEPTVVGTLAAAYAEAGQFDEAIKSAEKARELALAAGKKEIAARNAELIKIYQSRKPYHEEF